MEQINHQDDEHDQSSNEENTHDDHRQLLFKYLAESLQKQQQLGPIDFSSTSNLTKKEVQNDDEDEGDDVDDQEQDEDVDMTNKQSPSMSMIPPLLLRNKHGKPTRPFKAYPRDPLSFPLGIYSPLVPSSDNILNVLASTTEDFSKQFRKRIQQAHERLSTRPKDSPTKGASQEKMPSPSSTPTIIPPKKRYRPNTPPPEISTSNLSQQMHQEGDTKDEAYWERRRKNNEAAKRSRDARRAKEDEIALR